MQHFKTLFPVQYPRRRADHLKMVEGVRFNALKYGINNINLLYENDLRFLKQFKG